jgi:hypothetical protein
MARMIYPESRLHPDDIPIDIEFEIDYLRRYSRGLPAEPGDIPRVVNSPWPGPFPDAIARQMFWIVSKKFLDVVKEANGPQWPIRASDITFVVESGERFDFKFLEVIPRFHRFNHDEKTYPLDALARKGASLIEGVSINRRLASDPEDWSMRPAQQGDPVFWDEFGVVEGDTRWGGQSGDLFVSDALWEVLNREFPQQLHVWTVRER